MENCLFCKIIDSQIPSYTVYEDDVCVSFLDISQATLGHVLVLPKTHYDNILDIDEDVLGHLIKVAKMICVKMNKAGIASSFNILNNCGETAGQTIHHFHIHIIPRRDSKEMLIEPTHKNSLKEEEFKELQNSIINAINE